MSRATVEVPLPHSPYEVVIGTGLLPELSALLTARSPASHFAVITDSTVQPIYGERVAHALAETTPSTLLPFPAGEWNKTRDTWGGLLDRMLDLALDREAVVVALGGGVVGDVAGFVAATYLRGIRYVQVPTTLLAMIDSAVGGKTGLDTTHGKNLIGAFHQPAIAVADLDTLETLPPLQLAAGMAEALKHGAIADAGYFQRLIEQRSAIRRRDRDALLDVVRRSVEIKASVVAADERERGRRSVLNFGHTIAHALECVTGYELLHGEAVALGMLVEAELGREIGVTDPGAAARIRDAIEAFGLPLRLPDGATSHAFLEAMQRDKKVRSGSVRFALIETVGKMARPKGGSWTVPVPTEIIDRVIARFA